MIDYELLGRLEASEPEPLTAQGELLIQALALAYTMIELLKEALECTTGK